MGSLAIPLAMKGGIVQASDISTAMATEAQRRADSIQLKGSATFSTADLESLDGDHPHTNSVHARNLLQPAQD